ncbi:MAG: hypothetical protein ACREEM_00355, partial [Blastocatellia bacterium]
PQLGAFVKPALPHGRATDTSHATENRCNEVGFFEDFFDDKPETVAVFWRAVNRHLAAAAA